MIYYAVVEGAWSGRQCGRQFSIDGVVWNVSGSWLWVRRSYTSWAPTWHQRIGKAWDLTDIFDVSSERPREDCYVFLGTRGCTAILCLSRRYQRFVKTSMESSFSRTAFIQIGTDRDEKWFHFCSSLFFSFHLPLAAVVVQSGEDYALSEWVNARIYARFEIWVVACKVTQLAVVYTEAERSILLLCEDHGCRPFCIGWLDDVFLEQYLDFYLLELPYGGCNLVGCHVDEGWAW